MWFKELDKELDAEEVTVKQVQTLCADCGAYIDRINKVQFYTPYGEYAKYYCGRCKPPYFECHEILVGNRYYGRVQVDKHGVPVGYKKIKDNA